MDVTLHVNGAERTATDVWEGASLLTMLRDQLGLPGSKNACEQGECGSCTVLFDGAAVCACLVPAGAARGADVVTVEGVSGLTSELTDPPTGALHPVQQAFLDAGAVQCGFCTPGLIIAAIALLAANPDPDEWTIREELAGNLCRCTGYAAIVDAVRLAADRTAGRTDDRTAAYPEADR
jgi:carbon-monoxide dehydrogenase small subunit